MKHRHKNRWMRDTKHSDNSVLTIRYKQFETVKPGIPEVEYLVTRLN